MTHSVVINVFIWDQLVPLSTILVNISTSGWMDSNYMRIAFFGIIGFLQKTLAARISAPRRGTEAVQYSKLSSGGPLCSQLSSSPWGSIIRAPEPQKWARSKILKISKFYPFGPKNPFFGVQKAENWCKTSMSPLIHWKCVIGGENWWKNGQFTVFFSFFHLFQRFWPFLAILATLKVEFNSYEHRWLCIHLCWRDLRWKNQEKNNKHGDFQDLLRRVNFWVSDLDAFRWIFLAIFGHFLA